MELRKWWEMNIRQDNVRTYARVCSRHFQGEDVIAPPTPTGRRLLKKGAVPVLFHWNNFSLPVQQLGVWDRTERPDAESLVDSSVEMDCHPDHNYCDSPEPAALDMSLHLVEELKTEISWLQDKIAEITITSKFCLERFAASDDDIRFFTRFASYAHLMAFWKQIEPSTHKMIRVTRAHSSTEAKRTVKMVLQPIDEFFLFMNYLSLALMQKDLVHRFQIHQSTVSRIINTWANFLYTVLGAVGIWMDEETVKAHLPDVFHDYPDTRIILDCTELHCQTPSSLLLQSEVFSSYKSNCTFKGLIGMAPHGQARAEGGAMGSLHGPAHGAVTFVSSLYEGSISDKEILKQSGIVPLINPSMAIMVDKGFLVEDIVPCKVYIPTFLSKRAQLSGQEVRQTQSIARLRVHVERLIRRVKEHKLFSTVIPLSLTGSINQLYSVACLLVNYQNGPLVKAWSSND
ncbi:hypothetical protein N1851_005345 [Merluccius polli]|uniref:THAP-type domain-containing protein n=1 Tax=Merluccius polli TaxID=89951 RepID=A0AA47N5V7_MERPO|nr:hypothetical protein N1851_005345 [Merluccius polli]